MITPFGLLGINRLGQRLCLGKQAEARAPQPFIIRRREGCQERESGNVVIFQTLLMSRFCNSSSFGNVARLPTLPPVAIFLRGWQSSSGVGVCSVVAPSVTKVGDKKSALPAV